MKDYINAIIFDEKSWVIWLIWLINDDVSIKFLNCQIYPIFAFLTLNHLKEAKSPITNNCHIQHFFSLSMIICIFAFNRPTWVTSAPKVFTVDYWPIVTLSISATMFRKGLIFMLFVIYSLMLTAQSFGTRKFLKGIILGVLLARSQHEHFPQYYPTQY